MFTLCYFYSGSTHHLPIQKCSALTLRVNTKNIFLAYLLANYLKFNAPSFFFYSSTKFLLQKELLAVGKLFDKSSMKERRKKKDL